jgi:hypothetical protein
MTNDDQSSALGVGIRSLVGHWSLGIPRVRKSGWSMSRPATRGARAARQAGIADAMERQGVTRSVHHARRKKVSRCGASVRENVKTGERDGGTKGEGRRQPPRRAEMQDGGIWLVDDRSPFQITLTPALPEYRERGPKVKSVWMSGAWQATP